MTSFYKPERLEEYIEVHKWMQSVKDRSESEWAEVMKWYILNDLFFLVNFVLSESEIIHTQFGVPFYLHQHYLDACRQYEYQMKMGGGLDVSGRGSGKAVSLDTPIPTPNGWKNMEFVKEGDYVFDENGNPTRVTAISEIWHDRECYEVEFTDGEKIITSDNHQWILCFGHRKNPKLITSKELSNTVIRNKKQNGAYESKWFLPCTDVVRYDKKVLPIPPYTLGVWLGDGSKDGGVFCSQKDDLEIMNRVESDGFNVRQTESSVRRVNSKEQNHYMIRVEGLTSKLKELNLINNKHIPRDYIETSSEDRIELLRGLMDTDGTINGGGGYCTFTNTNFCLVDGVREIAASLGLRPHVKYKIAKLYGKACSAAWNVSFNARNDFRAPFHLSRKKNRLRSPDIGVTKWPNLKPPSRRLEKKLLSVKKIESVPTKCIEVDSSSHLYLCGKNFTPTHNSTIRTKAIPIQLILNYPNIVIFIFSATKNLSAKHVSVIKQELERNKYLNTLFPEILWPNPRKAVLDGQTTWSVDKGLCVQRSMPRTNLTIERHAFLGAGGVGSRPDVIIVDDVEHLGVVNNIENIEKIKEAMSGAVSLLTPVAIKKPILLITNTRFSQAAVVQNYYDQYMAIDQKRVRAIPAEDTDVPGNGPLGGTPIYPFDSATLWQKYNESPNKAEYGLQYALRYDLGDERALREDRIQWYDDKPEKKAEGCPIYVCIDASRGVYDPTAAFVWALKDKKFVWVDALVQRLDPTADEFYTKLYELVEKWKAIGWIAQVRVEEIGSQPWKALIEKEFNRKGCFVQVVGSTSVSASGKGRGKNDKIFERWAPMINKADVYAPRPISRGGTGLLRPNEKGEFRCLVDYFLSTEVRMFPRARHDDMLDAGALIQDQKLNAEFPLIWNTSNSIKSDRLAKPMENKPKLSWMSSF